MKARAAGLGLFTLMISACLPIPFEISLSQGAATAAKMSRLNTSLVNLQNYNPSARGFVFYPHVLPTAGGLDLTSGIVVSMQDLTLQVQAVRQDPVTGSYLSYGFQSNPIPNPDSHAPAFDIWPVQPTGSTLSYFLVHTFEALNPRGAPVFPPGGTNYYVFEGDPGGPTFIPIDQNSLNLHIQGDGGGDMVPIGASTEADPGGTFDRVMWLGYQNGAPGNFIEFSHHVDETGLGNFNTPRGSLPYPLPLPSSVTRCMYFYDENPTGDPARLPRRSFASWWDDATGAWLTWAWWGPTGSPPVGSMQLPVNHRLDAMLSTGQLLSTEGEMGRLYDRDGNLLATFPLGNLVYLGEKFVGPVPWCYFSQCLIYDHALHFNVYGIRTDQLGTLGS